MNLTKSISVPMAHSFDIMEFSYPPSAGAFMQELMGYMHGILNFHVQTGSKIYANMYPFFAYRGSKEIPLDYVLFEPNKGFEDPTTNLFYDNMLFAQIDSVYFAISMLGYNGISISVSETDWPSNGDVDEVGATLDNAAKYNGKLIRMVAQNKVTPLRPNLDLDVYIFVLFNENMKSGPTSVRNFGLFQPNGISLYSIQVVCGVDSSSAIERHNQIGLMLILCLASIALL
ncbi:glucan endo-1,3-beta-glucosidase 10-like [Castanea sativa]|uniref:glucan endo-1,3-beta-glucosidase 10-like n=1 Tax=Castanea sativa TaxID=21020 RepID=UPI003F64E9D8